MDVLRRNNVQVTGRGQKTILFAHGYGCDQNAWREIVPAFVSDWQVIAFDHVGAGGSDLSAYDREKYSDLAGYAHDIIEIIEHLDLEDVILVGHSVAAMMGALAAVQRPELFKALVMVCPSPCYIDDSNYVGGFSAQDIDELLDVVDANFLGWSRSMAPVIMGNEDRPELGATLTSSFCRTDPDIAREFARVTFLSDHRALLPRVTVPTLILQTREDTVAPQAVGYYMQREMPNSRLVLMNATGHCPHMSEPAETIEAICGFVS